MPRKKLLYTNLYPYHVMARSNNKDNFYVPKDLLWEIFISFLNQAVNKFGVMVHAFVLMDNHYHLILSTSQKFDLGVVMQHLQKSVSRTINKKVGRINHVFGGPYKASLIQTPEYYFCVYKYLYRNPINAGLCNELVEYKYSTYHTDRIPLSSPASGIASLIPVKAEDWINLDEGKKWTRSISKGVHKTIFSPVVDRPY